MRRIEVFGEEIKIVKVELRGLRRHGDQTGGEVTITGWGGIVSSRWGGKLGKDQVGRMIGRRVRGGGIGGETSKGTGKAGEKQGKGVWVGRRGEDRWDE